MFRKLALISALLVLAALAAGPALADGAVHQTVGAFWHAQQTVFGKAGSVPGASANLVRNNNGIHFQVQTEGLTPGNAYTLWLVVVNNPGACDPKPCTAPDILLDPATDSQVAWAGGHVAGGSGQGTFAGSARVGPLSGWLPGGSLGDPFEAEVHV
ncbi:MAG: hypothetical protein ACT4OP_03440, partial [Actinomycetota bacterium]